MDHSVKYVVHCSGFIAEWEDINAGVALWTTNDNVKCDRYAETIEHVGWDMHTQ